MSSYKLACVIGRILDDKIAKDITILNIGSVSSFADYFVICSAQSNTQVKALTENLLFKLKQSLNRLPIGKENDNKNRWNLIDFGDVVVHILHQEDRDAYAIEKFWNNALRIPKDEWLEQSVEYAEYENIER